MKADLCWNMSTKCKSAGPAKNPAENATGNSDAGVHVRFCMGHGARGTAGFHVVNLLESQHSFDSNYFIKDIMQPLVDQLFP
jgi:hypothetical protein